MKILYLTMAILCLLASLNLVITFTMLNFYSWQITLFYFLSFAYMSLFAAYNLNKYIGAIHEHKLEIKYTRNQHNVLLQKIYLDGKLAETVCLREVIAKEGFDSMKKAGVKAVMYNGQILDL